jgi:DNA polymerase-3 subunit epsilon
MKPDKEKLKEFKEKARDWALERLSDPKTLIIDLETTGILNKDPDTEAVQISAINTSGRSVFSLLIKPNKPLTQELTDLHGITNEMLVDSPTFPQIAKLLAFILEGKHVVAYNAEFDIKLLWHLFKKYGTAAPKTSGASCCMDRYSEWCGEWSLKKESFKWQRLPNLSGLPSHDALADCTSTLKVMELMSGKHNLESLKAEEINLDF